MSPWTVLPPADLTEEHKFYDLVHPALGILELGMSSFFRWQARQSGPGGGKDNLIGDPGYRTSVGLYVQWQRENHEVELRIERTWAKWEAQRKARESNKQPPNQPE